MFSSKYSNLKQFVQQNSQYIKQRLNDFRVYDLASHALDRCTSRQGYRRVENIAYGLKARHRLDLYLSEKQRFSTRPLVIFVYGGAWLRGDKSHYRFVGEALTSCGYDVAIINYQHAPQHQFPSYVHDVALALQFLNMQQEKYGISTAQTALMGHSAGAFNIVSLLHHPTVIDNSYIDTVRAVIGIAGPYHFDYVGDPIAADAFDQNIPYQQVMPYYFVRPHNARHYLFLAAKDTVVMPSNSYDLHQKLLDQGNHSELTVIPRTNHVSVMGSFASIFSRFFSTKAQVIKALDESFQDLLIQKS
ncbi:alpha/beta hydrolase [Acinetobacter rudis]|uniref:alpha/beta hydrolase n=1 Tax=Acinetobacter rudis TaxID=632955 RepID=UPI00280F8068|nr:alpha/beta hydrolase [Acinetobacter rudis]MDQ8951913.1 alpha/beta hydrolase [Acinetobacter rudis]